MQVLPKCEAAKHDEDSARARVGPIRLKPDPSVPPCDSGTVHMTADVATIVAQVLGPSRHPSSPFLACIVHLTQRKPAAAAPTLCVRAVISGCVVPVNEQSGRRTHTDSQLRSFPLQLLRSRWPRPALWSKPSDHRFSSIRSVFTTAFVFQAAAVVTVGTGLRNAKANPACKPGPCNSSPAGTLLRHGYTYFRFFAWPCGKPAPVLTLCMPGQATMLDAHPATDRASKTRKSPQPWTLRQPKLSRARRPSRLKT